MTYTHPLSTTKQPTLQKKATKSSEQRKTTSTLARSGMKSLGLARFVRFDDKAIHLQNNHRQLAREKIWMVSAAALPGWLQVFASPHFSRLPSLFYLEDSPLSPHGDGGFAKLIFLSGGVPQTPCAEQQD
jgi:hypothetical protein